MKKLLLLFIAIIIIVGCDEVNYDQPWLDQSVCFAVSQKFVKDNITFPESASFDGLTFLIDTIPGEQACEFIGDVYAKNAFGVESKLKYTGKLIYLGMDTSKKENIYLSENWDCEDIKISE